MKQLNGEEKFKLFEKDTDITINDFWSWAYSDLLNNTSRGILAEFLVHSAIRSTPPPEEFSGTSSLGSV